MFFVKLVVKLSLSVVRIMVSKLLTGVVSALSHTIHSGKIDCSLIARAVANNELDMITITMRKGPSSCYPPICFDPHDNDGSADVGAASLRVLSPVGDARSVDDSHFVWVSKCNYGDRIASP